MPLLSINEVCTGVRLGLWRMDEEPEELLSGFPHLRLMNIPYKNTGRRKEFLSVRALLLTMTGDAALRIDHTESGRPVVEGWKISISHTKGYAALMLSRSKDVGVDIEYRSERIAKIASHYIRPDEKVVGYDSSAVETPEQAPSAETLEQMLVLWCAKETVYKLYSDDNLAFFEMRAVGEGLQAHGNRQLVMENMKRRAQVTVHAIPATDYVLTWAVVD